MQTIYYRSLRDSKMTQIKSMRRGSWLHIVKPSHADLEQIEKLYDLDADILRDGIDPYESPRIERDEKTLYIFTRYSRPEGEHSSTEPLLIVLTGGYLVTLARHDPKPLQDIVNRDDVITTQRNKLLLQILTAVNAGYRQYLTEVSRQILAARKRLQTKIINDDDLLAYIDIEEDLNEYLVALQPYGILLRSLVSAKYINFHEDDIDLVEDLELSTSELIELSKSRLKTLQNLRDVNSTLAANNLNRVFKRLTSIAIFLSIPTVIGGLYGMNVVLPFGNHPQAFWLVAGSIVFVVSLFVAVFRWRRWV